MCVWESLGGLIPGGQEDRLWCGTCGIKLCEGSALAAWIGAKRREFQTLEWLSEEDSQAPLKPPIFSWLDWIFCIFASGLCPRPCVWACEQPMWAVRDVDLRKLHAPMPAAMLPCPAPAGSDWSFQNPVGVDCSSPEPRCIWLAVLRSATGSVSPSMPPAMPIGHGQSSHQPRVRIDRPSSASGRVSHLQKELLIGSKWNVLVERS